VALTINLEGLFRKQAAEARAAIFTRLSAGVGPTGKPLAPLARGKGPLGGTRVPLGVATASVTVRADGWSLLFNDHVALFHRGRDNGLSKQPKRPIAGFTREERARWQAQVEAEVAKQLSAQLARGGP
jgi:hypothetical protein